MRPHVIASRLLVASLIGIGLPGLAFAQAPAAGVSGSAAEAPAAAATMADPNIDRGFILPTAMTQPKGSLTYNNYELVFHGLTYGITDDLQISGTVLAPLTKDFPFIGFGSLKGRLVRAERFHLSLLGSVTYATGISGSDDDNFYTLGAGGFASFCLNSDCSSLLNAQLSYQLADASGAPSVAHLFVYGGSAVIRLSKHVKLLGEVTSAGGGVDGEFESLDAALFSYGVRFHSGSIAGDVGFIKPVFDSDDELLFGIPFINFSYRWE